MMFPSGLRVGPLVLVMALAGLQQVTAAPEARALSVTPGLSFENDQANSLLGNFVAAAGDVNGDGYGDVFASAPNFDHDEFDEGRIYLFLGGASGLQPAPAWTFEPDQENARARTAAAGDFDGDGYDDAIVGAALFDGDHVNQGRVWLFRGGPDGLESAPAWTADGDRTGAAFGGGLAAAGDVNADGFADFLISAGGFTNGEADEGAVFLYLGSPSGPSTVADWMVESNQELAGFSRVTAAGDVDGDGYDDFLIGAPSLDHDEENEGVAFLYEGSRKGPRKKPTILEIDEPGAGFGNSVSAAGDVDGDGLDDVIVGARGPASVERVFLFLGRRSSVARTPDLVLQGPSAGLQFGYALGGGGDVNGDGFDDVIVGARNFPAVQIRPGRVFVYAGSPSGLDPVPYQLLDGIQPFEEFGVSVASAGDVNDDGFGDVLVGAHAHFNPEVQEGRAAVFHGGP